jgi:hypothetical protein
MNAAIHEAAQCRGIEGRLDVIDRGADRFTFQTFHDKDNDNALTRIFNGTLEEHARQLSELNGWRSGVFVATRQTDQIRRRNSNMVRARVAFAEADHSIPDSWPLPPSIIVETSSGRLQLIWSVAGLTWEQFAARNVDRA